MYAYFCDLVEANHPALLGANHAHLPRLIAIVAECFHREVLDPDADVHQRMLNIVRQVRSTLIFFLIS